MNKPLREHFITPTDLGEALQTFRYIDELEKYINHLEQNQAQLQQHSVMQADGSDGAKEATVASEGQAEANTCADVWPNCVHKFEERIDGEWMCIYCGKRA